MSHKYLHDKLLKCVHDNSLRKRNVMSYHDNNSNLISINGKQNINFASNDYLGLKKHPVITAAFIQGIKRYGFGSGASVQVCGYFDSHKKLEQQFAQWLGFDKAIFFSSGYLANMGVITALAQRKITIFSDKLCHASLLDAIQLSRAKHYRYQHACYAHLDKLAQTHKPEMIVTESIFSMEGDIAPVQEISKIAQQYHSQLIIDDAHGIGILGKNGRGICEYADLNQKQLTCLIIPLGKALNGMGAMVMGRHEVMEAVLQFAKTYRYTTALPPAIAVALLSTLKIIREETWRREQLNKNIQFFIEYAKFKKLLLISADMSPIKAILIGDNHKALALQEQLLSQGFYVAAIRPPTVPDKMARLRISLNCLHTQEQLSRLIDCILKFLEI